MTFHFPFMGEMPGEMGRRKKAGITVTPQYNKSCSYDSEGTVEEIDSSVKKSHIWPGTMSNLVPEQ